MNQVQPAAPASKRARCQSSDDAMRFFGFAVTHLLEKFASSFDKPAKFL
jgi:hypothetical protein